MTQFITHKWLAALGLASSIAAFPALAAKDVVVAVGSNFTTLDPYDANDTLSQAVAKSFYQGLFGLDKDMKVKNVLAKGYTVSDDGLTYTITLRQGVKFQDGADFDAAAVKANLDRASNPDNHLKRYNLYKNIAKTEVVDPATVKITLKQPFSAFINILAHPATAIAKNKDEAYQFLNYLLRPDVIAHISDHVFYANANKEATALVSQQVRDNPGIYPPADVRAKLFTLKVQEPKIDRVRTRAWTKVKSGK